VADITPKSLTVSGVTAANKVYDASTTASLTGSAALVGVVAGDTVTASSGTGAFANKNAGTGKAVTVTGLTLSGDDAINYSVLAPTGLTADITPKSLSLGGVNAASKTYDGNTTASLNGTAALAGVIVGDNVTVSAAQASFADKNAGTGKTVTLSGVSLQGTDAPNYLLTAPGTLLADITPRAITASGLTATNKVYDGTVVAPLAGTISLTGLVSGDTVSAAGAAGSFPDKNVGTAKPVVVAGITLSGADAANYTVAGPAGLTADITPKALSVTGLLANDKVYDATTVASLGGSLTLAGLVTGDTVTATPGAARFADKNAGTAKPVTVAGITLTGTDAGNYTVTPPPLVASITPAPLTITANNREKLEGETVIFAGTEFQATGLVGGETVANVAMSSAGAPSAATAGSYSITPNTAAGANGFDAANYRITFNLGTLLVTAPPASEPQKQVESLVTQFAKLFVEEAIVQKEEAKAQTQDKDKSSDEGGTDPDKDKKKDEKKADITITDTQCK
jgi:hypothetical protein